MPNLKSLKALKKLMQEEGLLKQVQDLAKKNRLDSSVAKNLEEVLPIKKQAESLPVSSLGIVPGPRQRVTRAVKEARETRNNPEIHNPDRDRVVTSKDIENYPTSNLDLNARIRKDLEWAAGKERSKGIPYYHQDETVAPSRRMNEMDYQDVQGSDDAAEILEDYDYYDRKLHTEELKNKWSEIKNLLKNKPSK